MRKKVATFFIMLAFWVVMSGMFDGFHFSLGLLCCVIVAIFSSSLLFPDEKQPWIRETIGVICYMPYLIWQIILANIDVALIVLSPRMMDKIDPHLFRFDTKLKRPLSKVTFAQSITLTPGTITVNIHGDEFAVYALTRDAAESLPGDMEKRVARALEIKD